MTYFIASYNHNRFLTAAIESVLAQDYSPIELIVVDDGSTDGSIETLQSLREKHGFRLICKKNGGVCSVVNRAIPLASGDFIVPHASDDISLPSRTAAQLAILQQNPGAGFTVGAIRKINEQGELLEDWPAPERQTFTFEDFRMRRGRAIAASCMYRAEAIRAALPLDETISYEDGQLYWRVTEAGYTCIRDDGVRAVDYRVVQNSLGRSNKIRLHEDFIHFIDKYKNETWYPDLVLRANTAMLKELSQTQKYRALAFLAKNRGKLLLTKLPQIAALWLTPKSILYMLKKKW